MFVRADGRKIVAVSNISAQFRSDEFPRVEGWCCDVASQDARARRPIPTARVWAAPRGDPVELREALAGDGPALLCFYVFDWSTG